MANRIDDRSTVEDLADEVEARAVVPVMHDRLDSCALSVGTAGLTAAAGRRRQRQLRLGHLCEGLCSHTVADPWKIGHHRK